MLLLTQRYQNRYIGHVENKIGLQRSIKQKQKHRLDLNSFDRLTNKNLYPHQEC